MMDDLTTFQKSRIHTSIMEELENKSFDIFRPGSVDVADELWSRGILRNWLETVSTYLEISSLDLEVIMEVLNELKQFRYVPFQGSIRST